MRERWHRWSMNGVFHMIWMVGVTILLGYSQTTTDGDRHLPTGLGAVAFLVAAGWTLWIFRGA